MATIGQLGCKARNEELDPSRELGSYNFFPLLSTIHAAWDTVMEEVWKIMVQTG